MPRVRDGVGVLGTQRQRQIITTKHGAAGQYPRPWVVSERKGNWSRTLDSELVARAGSDLAFSPLTLTLGTFPLLCQTSVKIKLLLFYKTFTRFFFPQLLNITSYIFFISESFKYRQVLLYVRNLYRRCDNWFLICTCIQFKLMNSWGFVCFSYGFLLLSIHWEMEIWIKKLF